MNIYVISIFINIDIDILIILYCKLEFNLEVSKIVATRDAYRTGYYDLMNTK